MAPYPSRKASTARLNTLHYLPVPACEHTHTKAVPTGCRLKDTQTSFSQLPEQLKWPGRLCRAAAERIKERVSLRERLRDAERKNYKTTRPTMTQRKKRVNQHKKPEERQMANMIKEDVAEV